MTEAHIYREGDRTFVRAVDAAQAAGIRRDVINKACNRGSLKTAHKRHDSGFWQGHWYVEEGELRAYMRRFRHRTTFHPPEVWRWSPRVDCSPGPDGLTHMQRTIIAAEEGRGERLAAVRHVRAGAVRVSLASGESFTIAPNGETKEYGYANEQG